MAELYRVDVETGRSDADLGGWGENLHLMSSSVEIPACTRQYEYVVPMCNAHHTGDMPKIYCCSSTSTAMAEAEAASVENRLFR